jgi:hypothetical protein
MDKFRTRSYLDQMLFVVVIMAGAIVTAVLDVRAIAGAIASAEAGRGLSVAGSAPSPPGPPPPAASAARRGSVVARLAP